MARIRPARAEDAVRLAEIEVVNYRLYFYPIVKTAHFFFSELTVPALIDEYRSEPERIAETTVYDDGIVKGFLRRNGDHIEKLFVEPAFQGQGVGAALLGHAVDSGAKCLLVLEKNRNAIRFYERNGFHLTDRKQRVDDTEAYLVRMEL